MWGRTAPEGVGPSRKGCGGAGGEGSGGETVLRGGTDMVRHCAQVLSELAKEALARSSDFCLMWDNFLLPTELLLERHAES